MESMPRKRQAPIEFRIKALKVPRGTDSVRYLRSLLTGMDTGILPRGVQVELFWRNPETMSGRSKDWQSDDFLNAVSESNAGFASALRTVIQRKIYGGFRPAPPEKMIVRKKRKPVKGKFKKQTLLKKTARVKTKRASKLRKAVAKSRQPIGRRRKSATQGPVPQTGKGILPVVRRRRRVARRGRSPKGKSKK